MRLARRAPLTLLLLALLLPGPAPAQIVPEQKPDRSSAYAEPPGPSMNEAIAALNRGDYETAVRHLYRLAPKGNPIAQYQLATLLDNGLGASRDIFTAVQWYRKSAEQGYLPAVTYVGYMYATGHGVARNPMEAAKWYTQAAQMGDPVAQNAIGVLLRDGAGVKKNHQLAAQWFLQGATQGNVDAQSNLGAMYRLGLGVQKNPQEALRWFAAAAEKGDLYALTALGDMYLRGIGLPAPDPARAAAYYKQAADKDYLPAQLALAKAYEADETKGPSEAVLLYAKAAKKGDSEAQTRLGFYYENGYGLPQDKASALRWYTRALRAGYDMPALVGTARIYETGGNGVEADPRKAADYYYRCARTGDPVCQRELSRFYQLGKGVDQDLAAAYGWMALAAEAFPDGPDRDKAVVARVELSNSLSEEQMARARKWVDEWKPARPRLPAPKR